RDDGQGHVRQHQPLDRRRRRHFRPAAGRRRRGRAGAHRPAVRPSRLRLPRPGRQPHPHPGAELTMADTKTAKKQSKGFTAEERAAMKERAAELKAAKSKEEAERDVLAKIAEMPKADRVLAERIHAIVKAAAPGLSARTWYGMPAYANGDGKIVVFFK